MRSCLAAVLALGWTLAVFGQNKTELQPIGLQQNGRFQFSIQKPQDYVYTVEAASDLPAWKTIATLIGDTFSYTNPSWLFTDPAAGTLSHRFYRVHASPITPAHDWKNQIFYPNDSFQSLRTRFDENEVLWIKFAILTNEPFRVYFQNSSRYVFHYDFARARLPEFQGLSREQFDLATLRTNGQKAVLGSVLYAPNPSMNEIGIQFVGLDPYRPEQIAKWFHIVSAAIAPHNPVKVSYIPTFEQAQVAQSNLPFFTREMIAVRSMSSWTAGDDCYSPGWAIGTLKYFEVAQVANAYASGQLLPTDILLTDHIPAELPHLAGILSLSPATPNSHVAILARSHAVPFAHLGSPELVELANNLNGKQIVLDTVGKWAACEISMVDVSGTPADLKSELIAYKAPPVLTITPKARLGAYTTNTESLYPPDLKYVGGKAANFGFIRRTIPTNSPMALAITFDLWDDFLGQMLNSGKTLRQEIDSRLGKYTSYPPNVGALRTDLLTIRALIEEETRFTPAQTEAIAAALLAKFDPANRIRFRSSTNVEDSEQFTGAGLYDSYSGCLADDRDNDTTGPSICDSTESKERGVFRAIRKVYASFYNENAFLERLRHKVDESKVGMAILVHYSSPDPTEMANGVATMRYDKFPKSRSYTGDMVTQKGAVSVTNPDGSAVPEIVGISKFFDTAYANLEQGSSLVPLGGYVLNWGEDGLEYKQFSALFEKVAAEFEAFYPAKQNYLLDFEYKKIVPGELMVKQVRQIPLPNTDRQIEVVILNKPAAYCVFQGEWGDVFANHRLKSRFNFETRELRATASSLQQSIFSSAAHDYVAGGARQRREGAPGSWPNATHITEPLGDRWDSAPGMRLTLNTEFPKTVAANESPILFVTEMDLILTADYTEGQLGINFMNELDHTVTNENVRLIPCPVASEARILVTRNVGDSVKVETSFWWPEPPSGATAGYTAPLVSWNQTTITGLTSEPIVLRDYYSQTYRPQHHNFSEDFLFEPALDPNVSAAQRAELEAEKVRQILVRWGGLDWPSTIALISADGTIRYVGGKP